MVTRHQKRRLYLTEHREAYQKKHPGVSPEDIAKKLGVTRESMYRQEREPWRVNSDKQAKWADALETDPEALWRLPGAVSIDAMIHNKPQEFQQMAADIVLRLLKEVRNNS